VEGSDGEESLQWNNLKEETGKGMGLYQRGKGVKRTLCPAGWDGQGSNSVAGSENGGSGKVYFQGRGRDNECLIRGWGMGGGLGHLPAGELQRAFEGFGTKSKKKPHVPGTNCKSGVLREMVVVRNQKSPVRQRRGEVGVSGTRPQALVPEKKA